jgi:hypothetical protein
LFDILASQYHPHIYNLMSSSVTDTTYTMTSSITAITIFGSTGGTGLATLRHCLETSSNCINVLCRTLSKLLELLSLTSAPSNLHIISGSIYDASAVRACLLHPYTEAGSEINEKRLADIVVSSIGTLPSFSSGKGFKLNPFSGLDFNICEEGIKVILSNIAGLKVELAGKAATKPEDIKNDPILVALSGAGISSTVRDIPFALGFMYYLLLSTLHKDKEAMEDALRASSGQRWVIVRPSLLLGDGLGRGKGLKHVKVGLQREGKPVGKVAIGYTIQREDVATWIYEECIVGEGFGEKWVGGAVTLTY